MLYRIVVFVSAWVAISAAGVFLIRSLIQPDFGPVMVILSFLTFVASLLGANKVTDLFENWQRKRGLTTKRSTRIIQSKVLFALGVILIVAGAAYDLISSAPLKGFGVLIGLVAGLFPLTLALALRPSVADRIYDWTMVNGLRLGWAMVVFGSITALVFQPSFTAAYGALIAFIGLLTVAFTSAGRNHQNHEATDG